MKGFGLLSSADFNAAATSRMEIFSPSLLTPCKVLRRRFPAALVSVEQAGSCLEKILAATLGSILNPGELASRASSLRFRLSRLLLNSVSVHSVFAIER